MLQSDLDYLQKYFPHIKPPEDFWGFTCFSRQSYADKISLECEDEIMLGVYSKGGGCTCEMAIRWHKLSIDICAPRIECFDEAWAILYAPIFTRFLNLLMESHRQNLRPDEMSRALIFSGFIDLSDQPLPDDLPCTEN